ncbi:MAG: hypothetical protein HY659_02525 [Rhizobiales bacterium]|nr:hypothetical protein [Hyphomicrobiales bacterium]
MANEPTPHKTSALADGDSPPAEADYESIYNAVMETERGRWFLLQYAKHNRNADTEMVLAILARIEGLIRDSAKSSALAGPAEGAKSSLAPVPAEGAQPDLSRVADAIMAARARLAEVGASVAAIAGIDSASDYDGPATAIKAASEAIGDAIEHLQETSWFMHEQKLDESLCANLEATTREISEACVLLDKADDGVKTLIALLRELEALVGRRSAAPKTLRPAAAAVPPPSVDVDDSVVGPPAETPFAAAHPAPSEMTAPAVVQREQIELITPQLEKSAAEPAPGAADTTPEWPSIEVHAQAMALTLPSEPSPLPPPSPPVLPARAPMVAAPPAEPAPISRTISPPSPPRAFTVERQQSKPQVGQGGWLSELLAKNVQGAPLPQTAAAAAQVVALPRAAQPAPAQKAAPAPGDPLAPVMSLSDEERIALFS